MGVCTRASEYVWMGRADECRLVEMDVRNFITNQWKTEPELNRIKGVCSWLKDIGEIKYISCPK